MAPIPRRPGWEGVKGSCWLVLVTGSSVLSKHSSRHEQRQQQTFLSAKALYTSASSSAQMYTSLQIHWTWLRWLTSIRQLGDKCSGVSYAADLISLCRQRPGLHLPGRHAAP